jgi:hypothetical protein
MTQAASPFSTPQLSQVPVCGCHYPLSARENKSNAGTGVRMIDRTYGHLVIGSLDRARGKLDARAACEQDGADRFGAEWTPC